MREGGFSPKWSAGFCQVHWVGFAYVDSAHDHVQCLWFVYRWPPLSDSAAKSLGTIGATPRCEHGHENTQESLEQFFAALRSTVLHPGRPSCAKGWDSSSDTKSRHIAVYLICRFRKIIVISVSASRWVMDCCSILQCILVRARTRPCCAPDLPFPGNELSEAMDAALALAVHLGGSSLRPP